MLAWPGMPPQLSFHCYVGERAKRFGIRPFWIFNSSAGSSQTGHVMYVSQGLSVRLFKMGIRSPTTHKSLGKLNESMCMKFRK